MKRTDGKCPVSERAVEHSTCVRTKQRVVIATDASETSIMTRGQWETVPISIDAVDRPWNWHQLLGSHSLSFIRINKSRLWSLWNIIPWPTNIAPRPYVLLDKPYSTLPSNYWISNDRSHCWNWPATPHTLPRSVTGPMHRSIVAFQSAFVINHRGFAACQRIVLPFKMFNVLENPSAEPSRSMQKMPFDSSKGPFSLLFRIALKWNANKRRNSDIQFSIRSLSDNNRNEIIINLQRHFEASPTNR